MRLKLITILFLAITAVALVGYVSYIGLSNLMTILEETVQPDYREEEVQKLLYHISEAENSVRIYTITKESQYLNSFYSNVEEADTLIRNLMDKSKDDSYLSHHLDTIGQLLDKKTKIQNRLIRLKQDQKRINVYEEVLTKIQSLERKNAVFDSMEQAIAKAEKDLEKEIREKESELQEQTTETEEEKPGFFKRLFSSGKKEEQKQTEREQTFEVKTKQLDTLLAAKDTLTTIIDTLKKENITEEIESSLEEIKTREEQLDRELTIAELILTRRDKSVAQKIQHQVSKVQEYFNQLDVTQAREASYFFTKITDLIKIIGSIFSMLFLILVFIILNDIKVNQRFRKQLELAKNKAEDLARAKSDFLSNMSHEIRTPMNAIVGFAEQLNEARLTDRYRKYLHIIQNASHHLLSIINDILDYAKIEAGKIKLEKIPFSVEENAQIVYDTLYKNAKDKNLNFELEIGENIQNHHVKGDPVRFRQVLFNLAGNAIKFTKEGFVKIYINHDFRHIIIKVSDSGIGIEKDSLHLIFKKFDQASGQTSKKYGGTGLGLAIVKKLIEMQKGLITVKSEKDKGTEFSIKLPYIPTRISKSKKKGKETAEEISVPANAHILIADDEEYNILLLESILNKYQIKHKSAPSGKEVVENFQNENFDLVLIDLQMNDMDGFEATKILRDKINTNVPIIAATATATNNIKKRCLDAGMNDVLIKPITEKDLLKCLNIHLKKLDEIQLLPENKDQSNGEKDQDDSVSFEEVMRLFQNDKELALSMTNIFYNNLQTTMGNFKVNIKEGSLGQIKSDAHKIIPSTRHMGFEAYADSLKQLELNIENNEDLKKIEEQVNLLISDSAKLLTKLKAFLNSGREKIKQ